MEWNPAGLLCHNKCYHLNLSFLVCWIWNSKWMLKMPWEIRAPIFFEDSTPKVTKSSKKSILAWKSSWQRICKILSCLYDLCAFHLFPSAFQLQCCSWNWQQDTRLLLWLHRLGLWVSTSGWACVYRGLYDQWHHTWVCRWHKQSQKHSWYLPGDLEHCYSVDRLCSGILAPCLATICSWYCVSNIQ